MTHHDEWPTARAFLPPREATLEQLAAAARNCRGCPIGELPNSGTVFGEGRPDARLVLVGEQPGDIEDRRGRPFVGPAGKLLDRALEAAGLDRDQLWITNSVKHFKFTMTGPSKRRIHATPDTYEVLACKPWLEAELNRIRPRVVVLLGATAAKALLGPSFRVTKQRGQLLATIHPSAVLRAHDEAREASYAGLVADLTVAATALAGRS